MNPSKEILLVKLYFEKLYILKKCTTVYFEKNVQKIMHLRRKNLR